MLFIKQRIEVYELQGNIQNVSNVFKHSRFVNLCRGPLKPLKLGHPCCRSALRINFLIAAVREWQQWARSGTENDLQTVI